MKVGAVAEFRAPYLICYVLLAVVFELSAFVVYREGGRRRYKGVPVIQFLAWFAMVGTLLTQLKLVRRTGVTDQTFMLMVMVECGTSILLMWVGSVQYRSAMKKVLSDR